MHVARSLGLHFQEPFILEAGGFETRIPFERPHFQDRKRERGIPACAGAARRLPGPMGQRVEGSGRRAFAEYDGGRRSSRPARAGNAETKSEEADPQDKRRLQQHAEKTKTTHGRCRIASTGKTAKLACRTAVVLNGRDRAETLEYGPVRQAAAAGCAIVIPARFASTRLPGKPLLKDSGKYLTQHVYERASQVRSASEVVIATDDARIRDAAAPPSEGGSRPDCRTDDRVAEAAESLSCEMVVNPQGRREVVEATVKALRDHPASMATPVAPADDPADLERPAVKVVTDSKGSSTFLCRDPVRLGRRRPAFRAFDTWDSTPSNGFSAHSSDFPKESSSGPRTGAKRALEAGYTIQPALVRYRGCRSTPRRITGGSWRGAREKMAMTKHLFVTGGVVSSKG